MEWPHMVTIIDVFRKEWVFMTSSCVSKIVLFFKKKIFKLHSGGWNQSPLDTAAT
jgi:hypothetical protein